MHAKKIPSSDSAFAPPSKARLDKDDAVSHAGSMAHEGVMETGSTPKAQGVMGWGEREASCSGVMGSK